MAPLAGPLAASRAFAGVRADLRALLGARMSTHEFAKGARLIAQGAEGEALFVIVNGSVVVTLSAADETERILGFVGAGEVLGEMALVTKEARSASASSATRSSSASGAARWRWSIARATPRPGCASRSR